MNRVIIIFIKNLVPGHVKTRLAADMGNDVAYDVYRRLLRYTGQTVEQIDAERWLLYSQSIDHDDEWSEDHFQKHVQLQSPDLGLRMGDALKKALGRSDKAVIIGSDCPELLPEHIESAFDHLDRHDIVLGPSHDGGYYLFGCKAFQPDLFKEMKWSTSGVYSETVKRCRSLGLAVKDLEYLTDVDHATDLEKFPWLMKSGDY